MRTKRRLHHNSLGAVPGPSENMAGLRFSYAHEFGVGSPLMNEETCSINQ